MSGQRRHADVGHKCRNRKTPQQAWDDTTRKDGVNNPAYHA